MKFSFFMAAVTSLALMAPAVRAQENPPLKAADSDLKDARQKSSYGIGLGLTSLVNAMGASSSLDIFLVTPRLTAIALGFAVGMATIAGILPALRAARLDPVTALRSL